MLEGCDNTGKSTMARRLCRIAEEKYEWTTEVWHRGVPVRHPLEEYELDIEQQYPYWDDETDHHLIVADRWHLGQYVYGGLYREKAANELGPAGLWHVDNRLRSIGAAQYILDVPTELVVERENAGKSEDYQVSKDAGYLQMSDVDKVRTRYHECAMIHELYVYDPTGWTDDNLESILEFAIRSHQDAEMTRKMRTYIGPTMPGILLLGEKRGFHNPADLPRGAAFGPYAATSGRWLIDSLLTLPSDVHRSIGIANALEEDVEQMYEQLGRPAVVALGRIADAYLKKMQIPHGAVPHPQYMRRFHSKEREGYAQDIVNTAEIVR